MYWQTGFKLNMKVAFRAPSPPPPLFHPLTLGNVFVIHPRPDLSFSLLFVLSIEFLLAFIFACHFHSQIYFGRAHTLRHSKLILIVIHKIMHNQAPPYLIDQFHRVIDTTSYNLRNNDINLKLSMANTKNLKKSFIYQDALECLTS